MSDAINMDLQSSMLLETLRQTPSIQDNNHQDSGGGGSAGDGNVKSTSSSSLSSSADGGGGIGGTNSDGTSDKNALEAMDPAIMSTSAPAGNDSPVSGSGSSEKNNRTRYSVNQLLALRNLKPCRKKPSFMVKPKTEKLARMFLSLDIGTDKYGKSLYSMGKTSDAQYEDENGGGNGSSSANYGRNRVANGSNSGNTDGPSSGGGNRMDMRRSGGMDLRDPKDRLRKEDGIVLSPQRRSFNMGCQMPAAPGANTSGLNIGGGLLRNERDLLGGRERRIGSGRILSRDVSWDYRPDKDAPESNDFRASGNANYGESRDNRSSRENRESDSRDTRDSRDSRNTRETRESRDARDTRDRNDRDKDSRKDYDREERFERRPMNRDYDRSDKDSRNSRMSSRYSNTYNSNNDSHGNNNYHSNSYNHYHSSHHDRRRLHSDHGRDEEPEWFSEPTSQTDTIELRGFDDTVSEEETKSEKDDSRDDPKHDLESKAAEKDGKRPSSSLQNDKNNNDDASDVLLLGRSGATNDKTNANPSTSPNTVQMNRTPGDGASESSGKSALTTTLGISNTLGPSKITDDDFNFEDFLKLDALPSSLLYPDLPPSKDTGSSGGSRFSQWFKPDNAVQPPSAQQSGLNQTQQQPKQPAPHFVDSRRSSLQDEINNMINDFTSTGLDDQISDSNSNKYFAPISPAASTSSNSLLELFQRGEKQQQQQQQPQNRDREQHPQQQLQPQQQSVHPHGHPLLVHPPNHPGLHHQQQQQHHQQIQNRNLQQLLGVSGSGNIGNHGPHGPIPPAPSGGQIHSVEELEARFRQSDNDGNNRTPGTVPSIPRLITPSSATGGGNSSGGVGTGHLSNDAQQQDMNAFKKLLAQISENQPHNAQPTPAAHPPHHQSLPINILHHQQQQNDLLQKMLHLNQIHHPINDGRQAEILKRPEAQALLHGVARGEVTQHNLWQQLTNPATAQPHREILTSVLSTINTSPRVVSPNILIQPSPGGVPILPPASVPPAAVAVAAAAANSANLLFQHHSKQQMRLSPLPNGMPQRIPSPRELQYHTQSIMQNALIRKKLEEQRENYRKRQEQQQQQQQNRNQPETSSTPSSSTSSTTTSATATGVSSSVPSSNIQQIGNQPINTTANSAPTTVAASSAVATPVVVSSFASPAKQTPPSHSHSQHTSSPTPLAFTPTSVLRKMTAEKETEPLSSNNSTISTPSSSAMPNAQPSDRPPLGAGGHNQSILMGLNNPLTQQQQLQQRNLAALIGAHPPLQPPHSQPPGPPPQLPHHHLGAGHHPSTMGGPQPTQSPQTNPQQMRGAHQPPGMPGGNIPWNLKQPHPGPQMPPMSKPQGRPILKGGNTQPQPPQQQQHPSAMSQMSFASNLEFQQQMQQFQGRSGNPILGAHQSQQQQQQQQQLLQQQQQQPHNQHQSQMNPHLQQLLQQRQQQQQRAIRNQHMQQIPPSFRMGPQQPQQPQSQGQHSHQGQPQQPGASGIINYNRDGGLSPTSNQLARWFSPELLAQASAGKLPSLNVGQAMSLEEFERNMQHSSATVHN